MTSIRILPAPTAPIRALLSSLVLLTALVLLSACTPRGLAFLDASRAGPAPPKLAVLQSDVLVINGEAVRLADAVTPQASPDARCAAEALAARQAALELKSLISGVRTVTVTPTGARDDLNRAYAHVLLDGVDPAHDLIEDGLAVAPGEKRFDWCGPISTSYPRVAHIAALSFAGV